MAAVQIATRIDESIRNQASEVFAHYGLDVPSAIRMFLTTTATEKHIPMEIDKPVSQVSYKMASKAEALAATDKLIKEHRHALEVLGQ
jgi:DNA-damage-inducible protein J